MPRMREAMRSGSKGSSASVFSPTPRNTMGLPVTWRTDSAAPPRASPSALVRMTPVSSSAAPNARAAFTASWPAMASTTNRRSAEPTAASMSRTSAMRLSSTCSRPAVSTISASNTPLRARSSAARAIAAGAWPASAAKYSACTSPARRSSCSIAAGRRTSVLASSTRLRSRSTSKRASFAAVVVLPAPCRPASSSTTGGCARSFQGAPAPPMSCTSSVCRMPMNACPGVRLVSTSAPSALALTDSMNAFTTGSATSASSSATRASRSVAATFSSVMRPRPRRFSMVRARRAVRWSNMTWAGVGVSIIGPSFYARASAPPGKPRDAALNAASNAPLLLALLVLLLIVAFSSGTEVAMLSVNRYRIMHRAQAGSGRARTLERLLQEPDDWLGANLVILAVASMVASAIATILAQRTGHPYAVPLAVALLTIVVIVFCELTPKIYAASNPEGVALHAAGIYRVLVLVTRPALWLTSNLAYGLLRLFGVVRATNTRHSLSAEELRTVVTEAAPVIPARHRQMLLSFLDLGRVTVNDIMIPRQEISGIDVNESWEDILDQLRQTPHTRLPVYQGELDNLIGLLHMKRVAHELVRGTLNRERLIEIARGRESYFVPEGTALNVQLGQFQRNRRRLAFVVNEYGDIEGLVTLEDILEEIVGEFTTDPATVTHKDVHTERPGVVIVNASVTIRALNRALGWQLPTGGPKTVNGLLLEHLETIPDSGTMVRVGAYEFEVLQVGDNAIRTVRVRAPAAAKTPVAVTRSP